MWRVGNLGEINLPWPTRFPLIAFPACFSDAIDYRFPLFLEILLIRPSLLLATPPGIRNKFHTLHPIWFSLSKANKMRIRKRREWGNSYRYGRKNRFLATRFLVFGSRFCPSPKSKTIRLEWEYFIVYKHNSIIPYPIISIQMIFGF